MYSEETPNGKQLSMDINASRRTSEKQQFSERSLILEHGGTKNNWKGILEKERKCA